MSKPSLSPPPIGWVTIAAIWLGLGLLDASQSVATMKMEGMHHAWSRLFIVTLLSWLSWLPATAIVLWLGRLCPPRSARPLVPLLAHLGAAVTIALVFTTFTAALEATLNPWAAAVPHSFGAIWLGRFGSSFLSCLLLYIAILAIDQGLRSNARLVRREAEAAHLSELLAKAQLDALRRQVEPHFLFNTLNAIASLVRERRHADAIALIAAIGDLLRRVLDSSDEQQAPLGDEITFLGKYLDIQKARFGDRLDCSVEVPEPLLTIPIPRLILQSMVENAIKHGIEQRAQGGSVRVSAAAADGMITLDVYNDGPPLAEASGRAGIGIANTRARLQRLYGDRFRLTLQNAAAGVLASVSIPIGEDA